MANATEHTTQTLYSEQITSIGGFPITNSLLNTWLVVIIVLIFSLYIKKKVKEVPGKLQNVLEIVVEEFLTIFDSVTGSRQKSLQFFPFVFGFFVFSKRSFAGYVIQNQLEHFFLLLLYFQSGAFLDL